MMRLDNQNQIVAEVGKKIFSQGSHKTEIVYIHGLSSKVEIHRGQVETVLQKEEKGLGIRVVDANGKMGFFATTDLSQTGIESAYLQAKEAMAFSQADPHIQIYTPGEAELSGELTSVYDEEIAAMEADAMVDMALSVEKDAFAYDSRIKNSEKTVVSASVSFMQLLNQAGLDKSYRSSLIYTMTMPLAESSDGTQKEIGDGFEFSRRLSDFQFGKAGAEGAKRALQKLGARSVATAKYPLLLDQESTASLIQSLLPALYGESVLRGKSLFQNSLGKKIAGSNLQWINDAARSDGIDTVPMDDEGLPTRSVTLVQDGELVSFLHNLYSASYLKQEPTASASRSYSSAKPGIASANCYLMPHGVSAADLLKDLKQGILVQEFMGLHTIDPVSGDFSIGMSGQWIEKGKIVHPVSGLALAGNVRDLLFAIDTVADDLKFFLGGVGGSTVLLKDMSVSGS